MKKLLFLMNHSRRSSSDIDLSELADNRGTIDGHLSNYAEVPDGDRVCYDRNEQDLVAADQLPHEVLDIDFAASLYADIQDSVGGQVIIMKTWPRPTAFTQNQLTWCSPESQDRDDLDSFQLTCPIRTAQP